MQPHALSEEQDNPQHRAQILLVGAGLFLDDGQPDKALGWAQAARSLAGQIEWAEGEVRSMALEIEVMTRQDPVAAAHGAWAVLDWLENAGEMLRSLPALYLAMARAFLAGGDQEMAQDMASQAHRLVLTQAARLQPATLRDTFLHNSRINREIETIWVYHLDRAPRK